MCKVNLLSDNSYSLTAMKYLIEQGVLASTTEKEITIFLFEKRWLSEEHISALQRCQTRTAIVFALPESHEFITSFINGYDVTCFDYGLRLEDIMHSLTTLKKTSRIVMKRRNEPGKRSLMLTSIEQIIIELVLSGMTIPEISDVLGKKDKAVYQYKSIAMRKMGIATTAGLVNLGKYYIPHKTSGITTELRY